MVHSVLEGDVPVRDPHLYSERPIVAGFRSVNPTERWRENPVRALAQAGFSHHLECGIHRPESSPQGSFALIPHPRYLDEQKLCHDSPICASTDNVLSIGSAEKRCLQMGCVCGVMEILQSRMATATSQLPVRDIQDTVNPPRGFDQSEMLTSSRVWDYAGNGTSWSLCNRELSDLCVMITVAGPVSPRCWPNLAGMALRANQQDLWLALP